MALWSVLLKKYRKTGVKDSEILCVISQKELTERWRHWWGGALEARAVPKQQQKTCRKNIWITWTKGSNHDDQSQNQKTHNRSPTNLQRRVFFYWDSAKRSPWIQLKMEAMNSMRKCKTEVCSSENVKKFKSSEQWLESYSRRKSDKKQTQYLQVEIKRNRWPFRGQSSVQGPWNRQARPTESVPKK